MARTTPAPTTPTTSAPNPVLAMFSPEQLAALTPEQLAALTATPWPGNPDAPGVVTVAEPKVISERQRQMLALELENADVIAAWNANHDAADHIASDSYEAASGPIGRMLARRKAERKGS